MTFQAVTQLIKLKRFHNLILGLILSWSFFTYENAESAVWGLLVFPVRLIFQVYTLTRRRPLRRKLRMRWFFDISRVKESSFFKSDLTDPPSDFWCASFGKYQFKPFQISFSVGFISRSCFESDGFIAYSNEWDWSEKERCLFTLTNL